MLLENSGGNIMANAKVRRISDRLMMQYVDELGRIGIPTAAELLDSIKDKFKWLDVCEILPEKEFLALKKEILYHHYEGYDRAPAMLSFRLDVSSTTWGTAPVSFRIDRLSRKAEIRAKDTVLKFTVGEALVWEFFTNAEPLYFAEPEFEPLLDAPVYTLEMKFVPDISKSLTFYPNDDYCMNRIDHLRRFIKEMLSEANRTLTQSI